MDEKPVYWMGGSLDDLREMPEDIQKAVGAALGVAQDGGKPIHTKPLKGFKGAGVLEIVRRYDGDTYRAVYTVNFPKAIYALHVFQKKSKRGIETPPKDLNLIETRLKDAQEHYESNYQ